MPLHNVVVEDEKYKTPKFLEYCSLLKGHEICIGLC